MKSNHTPTPWRLDKRPTRSALIVGNPLTTNMVSCTLAKVPRDNWLDDSENEANADFILRAVNSHDKLLGALKYIERIMVSENEHEAHAGRNPRLDGVSLRTVRAAITEAEGRTS